MLRITDIMLHRPIGQRVRYTYNPEENRPIHRYYVNPKKHTLLEEHEYHVMVNNVVIATKTDYVEARKIATAQTGYVAILNVPISEKYNPKYDLYSREIITSPLIEFTKRQLERENQQEARPVSPPIEEDQQEEETIQVSQPLPEEHQQEVSPVSQPVEEEDDTDNNQNVIVSFYGGRKTKVHIHNLNEKVCNHMRETKNFADIDFLDFIRQHYPNHNEIIDVGAYIGNHTLFFAEFLNVNKIHIFEPVDMNFPVLTKNIGKYNEKCLVYGCALSNSIDTKPLYFFQKGNLSALSLHCFPDGKSTKVVDGVPTYTLDSFNLLRNITMIKINVTNYEKEVLEGAVNTIQENKPIIFTANMHHKNPELCPEPEPLKEFFSKIGYTKKYANIQGSSMDMWSYGL